MLTFNQGSDLRSGEQHPDRRDVLPHQHVGQAVVAHLRAHPRRHKGRVDSAEGRTHAYQDCSHLKGRSAHGLHQEKGHLHWMQGLLSQQVSTTSHSISLT